MSNASTTTEKTIISAQTVIKGEISFSGPAVICGRIEGQIRAEAELEITAEGSVEGDIYGAIVDIQGTVNGNVTASHTTRLGPNAKLIGELRASNLSISEGATFVGKVSVGGEASAEEAAPTAAPQASVATNTLQSRLAAFADEGENGAEDSHEEMNGRMSIPNAQKALKRGPVLIKAGS